MKHFCKEEEIPFTLNLRNAKKILLLIKGERKDIVSEVRNIFPNSYLALLVPVENKWRYRDMKEVNLLIPYEEDKIGFLSKGKKNLMKKMRECKFDCSVSANKGEISAGEFLAFLCRIPIRIGYWRKGCYPILNCVIESLEVLKSENLS